jgi:hypothetical protein
LLPPFSLLETDSNGLQFLEMPSVGFGKWLLKVLRHDREDEWVLLDTIVSESTHPSESIKHKIRRHATEDSHFEVHETAHGVCWIRSIPRGGVLHGHSLPQPQIFSIPAWWKRKENLSVSGYVSWLLTAEGFDAPTGLLEPWLLLEATVDKYRVNTWEPLMIAAVAEDNQTLSDIADIQLHVHRAGLNALSNRYIMQNVTGIDRQVLAVVLQQPLAASLLTELVLRIRILKDMRSASPRPQPREIRVAFICSHATHRSVAMCMLSICLIFRHSFLVLSTRKTQAAARTEGCQHVLDVQWC